MLVFGSNKGSDLGRRQGVLFALISVFCLQASANDFPFLRFSGPKLFGQRCAHLFSSEYVPRPTYDEVPLKGEEAALELIQHAKESKSPVNGQTRYQLGEWIGDLMMAEVNLFPRLRKIFENEKIEDQVHFFIDGQVLYELTHMVTYDLQVGQLSLRDINLLLKINREFRREFLDRTQMENIDTHLRTLVQIQFEMAQAGRPFEADVIGEIRIEMQKIGYEPTDYLENLFYAFLERPEFEWVSTELYRLDHEYMLRPDQFGVKVYH